MAADQTASPGWVFVPAGDAGPMQFAAPGAIISVKGRGPPWIVVDDDPSTSIISAWPGTLWRVVIVDSATPHDQEGIGGQPAASAPYTRAISVEVIEREDPSILFGPDGAGVLPLLAEAVGLTREAAAILAASRHPEAPCIYGRVFRRWADGRGIPLSEFVDLDGVLQLASMHDRSPLNEGLSLLHRLVFERAKRVDRGRATRSVHGEERLAEPWAGADRALRDAALASGARRYLDPGERDILMSAIRRL